jgi:glycosyltransferase involved in cell wall biosynthesis
VLEFRLDGARVLKNWACEGCNGECHCIHAKSYLEVLVSTFNHESSVVPALESIARQTIDHSEVSIFVHDDGSTDATVRLVEQCLSGWSFKYTIVSRVCNEFVEKRFSFFFDAVFSSRSKYVGFLDGDDLWVEPGKLRTQVTQLDRNPMASICHTSFVVSVDGQPGVSTQPDPSLPEAILTSPKFLRRENFIGTATAVLRTAALGPKPVDLDFTKFAVADYPIWLLATKDAAAEILFVGEVTAQYNIHRSNYWASGSLISRLRRNRNVQRFLSHQLGETVGSSILRFALRVLHRRLYKWLSEGFRTLLGRESR